MAEMQDFQQIPTRDTFSVYLFITLHQLFSSIYFRSAFHCGCWIRYSICICSSAAVISGLLFGHELVDQAVVGLITYLTDTWETDNVLIKSATLVNCQQGLSATLVIIMAFVSDTQIGCLKPIICLSGIYILGLAVLAILSLIPGVKFGTGHIIAVFFLAAGKAIVQPAKRFMSDQLKAHEPKLNIDENRVEARTKVWCLAGQFLAAGLIFLVFNNLGSWSAIFTHSTFVMATAFFLFLYWTLFYHCKEATGSGSPFAHIFYVVKAAFPKRGEDEAAVIYTKEEEKSNKLFNVSVTHSKLLLTMFPLWTTFFVFGLGLTTADTFFPEQGNNMESGISILLLFLLKNFSGWTISSLCDAIISKWVPSTKMKCCHLLRIWLGMLLSVFCFILARWVEVLRLEMMMSTWWLAPQFCIFGLMERLALDGLDDFFRQQVPAKPLENYGLAFQEFFIGIGNLISVICVHAAKTCFRDTLNLSRLDKYYTLIAIICFINLCFYSYVVTLYWRNINEEEEQEAEPSNPDVEAIVEIMRLPV